MSEKLVTLAIAILKKKMKTNFFCRWRKTFFLSDCSPASEKTRTIAKSKLRKFSRQKFYVTSLFFRRIIKDPSEQEEIMMKRFLQIPIFSSFWARFNFHLAISLPFWAIFLRLWFIHFSVWPFPWVLGHFYSLLGDSSFDKFSFSSFLVISIIWLFLYF